MACKLSVHNIESYRYYVTYKPNHSSKAEAYKTMTKTKKALHSNVDDLAASK